jgi:ATP synthase I subunit
MANEPFGTAALRRIEWLTLALGGVGAAWAGWRWGGWGSAGLALGAAISWVNFRWLKGSVQAFGRAATAQAGSAQVRVPVSAYVKFFARFALLLGILYVILTRSWLPVIPVLAGLFASAAAVVLALVYELVASGAQRKAGGPQ